MVIHSSTIPDALMTAEPDETGFDARLRAVARTILDEEVPALVSPFGREDDEVALFTAMQTFAVLKGLRSTSSDMAACEAVGRAHARLKAASSASAT